MKRVSDRNAPECSFNSNTRSDQGMQRGNRLEPAPYTPPARVVNVRNGWREDCRDSFRRRPALAIQAGRWRIEKTIPPPLHRPSLLLRGPMHGSFTATKALGNLRGGEKCLAARHVALCLRCCPEINGSALLAGPFRRGRFLARHILRRLVIGSGSCRLEFLISREQSRQPPLSSQRAEKCAAMHP
jgi:hypothetical protein